MTPELPVLFVPQARQRSLLQAMIFGRILFPGAKLALAEAARGTLLAAACGLCQQSETFDEDDLYEAMDALDGRWVGIEKQLYSEAFPQAVSLVLYDLTSVYFEGKGPRGLGEYGYSRDHREDRPRSFQRQRKETAKPYELLRGNRTDTTTLQGLLASLKRRFGIRRAVFVFDNGMSSTLNLEAMRKEDLHFVTRLSTATLREVVAQLPQEDQPQLWDRTKLIELTLEGKRYVIAGGVYRQQRDFARRSARLEKAQRELKRLAAVRRRKPDAQKLASQAGRALQRLKAHKYFRYWVDEKGQLNYQKNDELIEIEQSLDGLYLLHTSLEPVQCGKGRYLGLTSPNGSFGRFQPVPLSERPISIETSQSLLVTCKEVEDESDNEDEDDLGSGGRELRPSIAGIVCIKSDRSIGSALLQHARAFP